MSGPRVDLHTGDALATLATLPANSFDAMLCDPPYGIAFMGREWDKGVPSAEVWREALRVLKPGAFALVACGTRTQHRMACALEDAGFEIRDLIAWIYSSGFPKSLDVSKAIDNAAGAEREVIGVDEDRLRRKPNGMKTAGATAYAYSQVQQETDARITAPATPDAARWHGYGTALKPAMELWTLVRKPLDGTVAANALQHGVGGLNIDGCRVGVDPDDAAARASRNGRGTARPEAGYSGGWHGDAPRGAVEGGRWPANVVHDGSDEVTERFPDTVTHGGGTIDRNAETAARGKMYQGGWGDRECDQRFNGDSGSAARFFYCAKAGRKEREGSTHPTVKPLTLTTYLATLLLPPAGHGPRRVLVPFSGIGSEVIGALRAGWDHATGIEIDPEYVAVAHERLAPILAQPTLFEP